MGIFNIFIKKENKFLFLLNSLVDKLADSSEILVKFMQTPNVSEREDLKVKIKEIEVEGDNVYDNIFEELNTTFITPFDREDIQELAAKMDDVLDYINGIAKRTIMYNPQTIPHDFFVMAEIIRDQCFSLKVSMSGLGKVTKNPDFIKKECQKIHELETKADEVYANFIAHLFAECKDPIELVKLDKIIQYLEDATDTTEDVADVIKTIIVKYN